MFWRFGFTNVSSIDSVLEKQDVTLEEVLNDQDIIQETKSQNPKLIEFLIKRDHLSKLFDLFFDLNCDKERLPLVACEILSCDNQSLIDTILIEQDDNNIDILKLFWNNFLNIPYSTDLSYTFQASYFYKIITSFLTKRTVEMLDFIKSMPIHNLLSNLKSSAIMDLVLNLIKLEELPEAKGTIKWLSDHGLLTNLINRLNPSLDINEHYVAQQLLSEIIRISQTSLIDSPSIGINDLVIQLTSEETIEKLVGFMLDKSAANSNSTLINGVTIIIDLIRHNNVDLNQFPMVLGQSNNSSSNDISLIPMLTVLTQHIEPLNQLLSTEVTNQATKPVLGLERLKICELFAELLHCSNMSSLNLSDKDNSNSPGDLLKLELVKHKTLSTCIDLFFQFPWNNLLHYVVYDIIHQVLNGPMNKESNQQLTLSIFIDTELTNRIIKAQEENDIECEKPKGMRLGYMGHLTFISDEIIKLFSSYSETITNTVAQKVDLDAWKSYCSNQLEQTRRKNNLSLGENTKLQPIQSDDANDIWINNETSAGVMDYDDTRDSFDEDYTSSSSDEAQDPFATKAEESDEDEEDPFGDFNSFEDNADMNAFTTNFSDMDLSHAQEQNLAQA